MRSASKIILIALLALPMSCGLIRSGNSDAYEGLSESCSDQFLSDYNSLVYQAFDVESEGEMRQLQESIGSFKNVYEDVECDASVGGSATVIVVNEVERRIVLIAEQSIRERRENREFEFEMYSDRATGE